MNRRNFASWISLHRLLRAVGLSAVLFCHAVFAATEHRQACTQVKAALLAKDRSRFSVPFEQPNPDQTNYRFDLDKNGVQDRLEASCGNGADATCEMQLFMNGQAGIEFSVPASVRLLEIERRIFIATGVSFHHNGRISQRDFTVRELHPGAVTKLKCGKLL